MSDTDMDIQELARGHSTSQRIERVESQKAKGIVKGMGQSGHAILSSFPLFLDDSVHMVERAVWNSIGQSPVLAAFIRACPVTPRHGVLESAATTTVSKGVQIFNRIKEVMDEVEPDGCIIVQPYIRATSSAVLAPENYITIGPEHDGVTAGHGRQMTLPLRKGKAKWHWVRSMGEQQSKVELEFVHDSTTEATHLVQVRRCKEHAPLGSKVVTNGDEVDGFLPSPTMKVKEVFTVHSIDDIAALEARITGPEQGLLVCHPEGSLLSHASAHCRANEVAYIVGSADVGKTLKSESRYNPKQYGMAFQRGIEYARKRWRREWGYLGTFFHQYTSTPLSAPAECAFLAGCYVGWMLNAGLAACLGELRHSRSKMDHYHPNIALAFSAMFPSFGSPPTERAPYYAALEEMTLDYTDLGAALSWCETIYKHGWGGGGYGGHKWGQCTTMLLNLLNAVESGDTKEIIVRGNSMEHASHNNGWLFNKFVPKEVFDLATFGFLCGNGNELQQAFKVYEMGCEILGRFGPRLSVKGVRERLAPTQSWVEPLDAESRYDLQQHMSGVGYEWHTPRGSAGQGCSIVEGCIWCVGNMTPPSLHVATLEAATDAIASPFSPTLHECMVAVAGDYDLTEGDHCEDYYCDECFDVEALHAKAAAMHASISPSSPPSPPTIPPQATLANTGMHPTLPDDREVAPLALYPAPPLAPSADMGEGMATLLACNLNGMVPDEHAKQWAAAIQLVQDHAWICKQSAQFIWHNISVQKSGLTEQWNTALKGGAPAGCAGSIGSKGHYQLQGAWGEGVSKHATPAHDYITILSDMQSAGIGTEGIWQSTSKAEVMAADPFATLSSPASTIVPSAHPVLFEQADSNGTKVSIPVYVPSTQWASDQSNTFHGVMGMENKAWHAGIALAVEASFADKTFHGVIGSAFTWAEQILPMHKNNPHDEGSHFGKAMVTAKADGGGTYSSIPGVFSAAPVLYDLKCTEEEKNAHANATYIPLYQWFSLYRSLGWDRKRALKHALATHLLLEHGVVTPTGLYLYKRVSFSKYTGAVSKWNAALEGAGILEEGAHVSTAGWYLEEYVNASAKKGWEDETLDDILTLYKQTMKQQQE